MKRTIGWMPLCVVLVGCGGDRPPFAFEWQRLMPRDRLSRSWVLVGKPRVYGPANLYEYLDGRAQVFNGYGMRSCIHAEYRNRRRQNDRLILDLFEMSDSYGSFGLLGSGRGRHAEPLELGAAGYWQDDRVCWVRDRIYARVIASEKVPDGYMAAVHLAMVADSKIDLPARLPAELRVLPEDRKIHGSELFVAADLLGHGFLGSGWMADYRGSGGVEFRLFWVPSQSEEEARQRFDALRQFGADNGRVVERQAPVGQKALFILGKYTGRLLVILDGPDIAGTVDCLDDKLGAKLINELLLRAQDLRQTGIAHAPG